MASDTEDELCEDELCDDEFEFEEEIFFGGGDSQRRETAAAGSQRNKSDKNESKTVEGKHSRSNEGSGEATTDTSVNCSKSSPKSIRSRLFMGHDNRSAVFRLYTLNSGHLRKSWREAIESEGGTVVVSNTPFSLDSSDFCLVPPDEGDFPIWNKLGVDLFSTCYVEDCIDARRTLDPMLYLLATASRFEPYDPRVIMFGRTKWSELEPRKSTSPPITYHLQSAIADEATKDSSSLVVQSNISQPINNNKKSGSSSSNREQSPSRPLNETFLVSSPIPARAPILSSTIRVSDDDDDDDSSAVSGQKRRNRGLYSIEEKKCLLRCLLEHRGEQSMGGVTLWKLIEKRWQLKLKDRNLTLEPRTWSSLKENFRKQIMPSLDTFGLEEDEQKEIRTWKNGCRVRRKRRVTQPVNATAAATTSNADSASTSIEASNNAAFDKLVGDQRPVCAVAAGQRNVDNVASTATAPSSPSAFPASVPASASGSTNTALPSSSSASSAASAEDDVWLEKPNAPVYRARRVGKCAPISYRPLVVIERCVRTTSSTVTPALATVPSAATDVPPATAAVSSLASSSSSRHIVQQQALSSAQQMDQVPVQQRQQQSQLLSILHRSRVVQRTTNDLSGAQNQSSTTQRQGDQLGASSSDSRRTSSSSGGSRTPSPRKRVRINDPFLSDDDDEDVDDPDAVQHLNRDTNKSHKVNERKCTEPTRNGKVNERKCTAPKKNVNERKRTEPNKNDNVNERKRAVVAESESSSDDRTSERRTGQSSAPTRGKEQRLDTSRNRVPCYTPKSKASSSGITGHWRTRNRRTREAENDSSDNESVLETSRELSRRSTTDNEHVRRSPRKASPVKRWSEDYECASPNSHRRVPSYKINQRPSRAIDFAPGGSNNSQRDAAAAPRLRSDASSGAQLSFVGCLGLRPHGACLPSPGLSPVSISQRTRGQVKKNSASAAASRRCSPSPEKHRSDQATTSSRDTRPTKEKQQPTRSRSRLTDDQISSKLSAITPAKAKKMEHKESSDAKEDDDLSTDEEPEPPFRNRMKRTIEQRQRSGTQPNAPSRETVARESSASDRDSPRRACDRDSPRRASRSGDRVSPGRVACARVQESPRRAARSGERDSSRQAALSGDRDTSRRLAHADVRESPRRAAQSRNRDSSRRAARSSSHESDRSVQLSSDSSDSEENDGRSALKSITARVMYGGEDRRALRSRGKAATSSRENSSDNVPRRRRAMRRNFTPADDQALIDFFIDRPQCINGVLGINGALGIDIYRKRVRHHMAKTLDEPVRNFSAWGLHGRFKNHILKRVNEFEMNDDVRRRFHDLIDDRETKKGKRKVRDRRNEEKMMEEDEVDSENSNGDDDDEEIASGDDSTSRESKENEPGSVYDFVDKERRSHRLASTPKASTKERNHRERSRSQEDVESDHRERNQNRGRVQRKSHKRREETVNEEPRSRSRERDEEIARNRSSSSSASWVSIASAAGAGAERNASKHEKSLSKRRLFQSDIGLLECTPHSERRIRVSKPKTKND